MTILEKIKFEEDWLSEVSLTKENIKIAFDGIRATALESQRWIPVSEKEAEFPCIACDKYNQIFIPTGIVKINDKCYGCDGSKNALEILPENVEIPRKIIAWMPLPEPFEEGEDED